MKSTKQTNETKIAVLENSLDYMNRNTKETKDDVRYMVTELKDIRLDMKEEFNTLRNETKELKTEMNVNKVDIDLQFKAIREDIGSLKCTIISLNNKIDSISNKLVFRLGSLMVACTTILGIVLSFKHVGV